MDEDLHEVALGIAIQAGAVQNCYAHSHVWVDQGDTEANSRAYAIATNKWKRKEITCERQDILDAVKFIIDQSADECPVCQKIMRE